MGTVHVGISHNNNLVVADFIKVKILTDAGTERCNNRLEFLIAEYLVEPGLFDVQHLSPQRQNCLRLTVAPLLCGTACRITFYNVDLAFFRVFGRTVGEFSRQPEAVKTAFSAGRFLCLARCDTGGCFSYCFFEDFIDFGRILLKKEGEFFVDKGVNNAAYVAVAELGLRLSFKLRLGNFDRQYRR